MKLGGYAPSTIKVGGGGALPPLPPCSYPPDKREVNSAGFNYSGACMVVPGTLTIYHFNACLTHHSLYLHFVLVL